MPEKVAPARLAAFDILLRLERTQGHSDELLHSEAVARLSPVDRNLTTALVMGILRWQLVLDAQIAAFLARPKARLDDAVRIALRMGALQLQWMDRIPNHAAISESVDLAKRAENPYAAGMVNAVLRKIARVPKSHPDGDAASAHPAWILERWKSVYGPTATSAICRFDQEQPVPVIRLVHADAEESLRQEGIELESGAFLTAARRVIKGDVTATDAFRQGMVRIQEEASQLVAELAGEGTRILDACAAPGGKTAVLAERNPQAEITACDVSSKRLEHMKAILQAYPFSQEVSCRVADASLLNERDAFDLILCDVPCSGTGTLARNPEIRYRLAEGDLRRQQKRLREILRAAMQATRPGGRLVYSTCSLEPEENEQVIESSLTAGWRFVPMAERLNLLCSKERITQTGLELLTLHAVRQNFLRTIPGVVPCDGFFAAVLAREG
jgi:16S rRNA (cytosine967-C5)-methyltransferase